jgi:endonuclease YncB( thermonuclease family)
MAAQTFIRWSRLGVWERLLAMVQARGVELGMAFLDGDTIRMVGLDAPEKCARCPAEARLAARATARLHGLVQPGVWLERHGRDRYRRTLAIVRDLAQVMIREGLARPYNGRGRTPTPARRACHGLEQEAAGVTQW